MFVLVVQTSALTTENFLRNNLVIEFIPLFCLLADGQNKKKRQP